MSVIKKLPDVAFPYITIPETGPDILKELENANVNKELLMDAYSIYWVFQNAMDELSDKYGAVETAATFKALDHFYMLKGLVEQLENDDQPHDTMPA